MTTATQQAGSELSSLLGGLMASTSDVEVEEQITKLEKLGAKVESAVTAADVGDFVSSTTLRDELFGMKKQLKNLGAKQKEDIATLRKETQERKVRLQQDIKDQLVEIRASEIKEQTINRALRAANRAEARGIALAAQEAKRIAREEKRALKAAADEAKAAERKVREDAKALKRQLALSSAAERTAAAKAKEDAARAALEMLANQPAVRKTRVVKKNDA